MYFLYLKKSFMQRKKRHLVMLLTFVCALVMPFIVSIYRSSIEFGIERSLLNITKGATLHILNAKEEYLTYFNRIEGTSARYEDGVIYISILSEEDKLSEDFDSKISGEAVAIAGEIEGADLQIKSYFEFGKSDSLKNTPRRLVKIDIAISLVAILIAFSAYGSYIRLFKEDIGVLSSLGMKKQEIAIMFMLEFAVLLFLASVVAFLISSALMKVISYIFFIRNFENNIWIEYRADFLSILLHVPAFLLTGIIVIYLNISRFFKRNICEIMQNMNNGSCKKHYKRRLKVKNRVESLLAGIFLKRSNDVPLSCALMSIPVIVMIIISFQYIIPKEIDEPPKSDITIMANDTYRNKLILSEDEIDRIKALDGIKSVDFKRRMFDGEYMLKDERMDGEWKIVWYYDNAVYAPCFIYSFSEKYPDSKIKLKKDEVVINKNHKYLTFDLGGEIILQVNNSFKEMSQGEAVEFTEPYKLKIIELTDEYQSDGFVKLYLSDELYKEFMKDRPIGKIELKLSDTSRHGEIISKIKEISPVLRGTNIIDDYGKYEINVKRIMGEIIMYSSLFGIMLIFLIAILGIRIYGHMNEQRGIAGMLSMIGADRQSIFKGYLRQMRINFAAVVLTAFVLAYALLAILLHRTGMHVKLDLMSISIQAGILLSIYLAYCLPVHWVFGKSIKSTDKI